MNTEKMKSAILRKPKVKNLLKIKARYVNNSHLEDCEDFIEITELTKKREIQRVIPKPNVAYLKNILDQYEGWEILTIRISKTNLDTDLIELIKRRD